MDCSEVHTSVPSSRRNGRVARHTLQLYRLPCLPPATAATVGHATQQWRLVWNDNEDCNERANAVIAPIRAWQNGGSRVSPFLINAPARSQAELSDWLRWRNSRKNCWTPRQSLAKSPALAGQKLKWQECGWSARQTKSEPCTDSVRHTCVI
jgi:hypothetical protein